MRRKDGASGKHTISKRTNQRETRETQRSSGSSRINITERQLARLSHSYDNLEDTFGKKGKGLFQDLSYSSVENPLGPGMHLSGTLPVTGPKKKQTPNYYSKHSVNPMSQSTVQLQHPKLKLPPRISYETKEQCSRRDFLPSDRLIKPFVKRYYDQDNGFILQHAPNMRNPERKEYESTTTALKNVIQYGFVRHRPTAVTGKITQMNR